MSEQRKTTAPKQWGSITIRRNRRGEAYAVRASYNPPDGSPRIYRDHPTKEAARAWLDREHALVQASLQGFAQWTHPDQRDPRKKTPSDGATLLRDFAQDAYPRQRVDREGRLLAAATLRHKDLAYRRIIERFGDRRLDSITTRDVHEWLRDPGFQGREPLRIAYGVLRNLLEDAYNPPEGGRPLIERQPCTMPTPAKEKSKAALIPPATPAQVQAIRDNMPPRLRLAIDLFIACGLRPAEACALQIGCLDPTTMTILVRHSARRGEGDRGPLHLGDTKNETSMDRLPMPRGLWTRALDHIREHCRDQGPEAMLFQPPRARILSTGEISKYFDRAKRAAGRPDLQPHILRATAITQAVEMGATPKDVQLFGRHADVRVSLEHYQRAHDARRRIQIVEDVYSSMLGSPRDLGMLERERDRKLIQLRALQDDIERLDRSIKEMRRIQREA